MKTTTTRNRIAAVLVLCATVGALVIAVNSTFAQRGPGGFGDGPGFGRGGGFGLGGFGPGFGHGGPFGHRGPGRPGGPDGFPVEKLLRLKDKLDLSDEQVDQIKSIIGSATEEMQAHREDMKRLREAMHEAVTGDNPDEAILREIADQIGDAIGDGAVLKASIRQSVMAVLTDEQKAELEELKAAREELRVKFDEFRAELKESGFEGKGRGRGPGHGFGRGPRR